MGFQSGLFERPLAECMNSNAQSFIVTILTGVLAAGTLGAEARTFELGPAEGSNFSLEVYKTRMMAGKNHVFVFERYSGEATFDEQKPEDTRIRSVVEAGSVACTDTWVSDGNRRKVLAAARDDVMAVDKYPQLIFASSKVAAKGENQYEIQGALNIRGVVKPVLVRVTRKTDAFEGEATVKLSDYGLKAPTGPTMGFIGTKDEMKVMFRLVPKAKAGR